MESKNKIQLAHVAKVVVQNLKQKRSKGWCQDTCIPQGLHASNQPRPPYKHVPQTYLYKKMDALQIQKLIIIHVDAENEVQASVAPVHQLVCFVLQGKNARDQ